MGIQIISKETIKPSIPTPNHLKTYKLSFLDQCAPPLYIPFIFFYSNKFAPNPDAKILTTQLKNSLSRVLTIYYPLAGRLKDCASVDCNDQGVEFIEAWTSGSLSEFLKRPDMKVLNNFLPCSGNVLEKTCSNANANALVKVKATVFDECGGIVIGVCFFHRVGDVGTVSVFLDNWAKISRGSNEKVEHPNFTVGSDTFPARLTNDFVTNFDNFYFRGKSGFVMRRYVFDPTAIRTLKNKAASKNIPNPTRVEALSAFVVKHMNAASSYYSENSTTTTLMITHAVNLRRRMEPPLPDSTFGNILWLAFSFYELCDGDGKSEKIINTVELVENISDAIVSLNKENVSELKADDAFTSMTELMGSVTTNDKIKTYRFTSWCNMGLYDLNFGWGNPIWVAHMGNIIPATATGDIYRSKQQFVFIESGYGKGIELWMAADEKEISILENNMEFVTYATPNPPICVD